MRGRGRGVLLGGTAAFVRGGGVLLPIVVFAGIMALGRDVVAVGGGGVGGGCLDVMFAGRMFHCLRHERVLSLREEMAGTLRPH